jgi:hypothetical protein
VFEASSPAMDSLGCEIQLKNEFSDKLTQANNHQELNPCYKCQAGPGCLQKNSPAQNYICFGLLAKVLILISC